MHSISDTILISVTDNKLIANTTLQVFRAAHRARVMSYLQEPAPERLVMTAGKSVLENSSTKGLADALKPLDDMLATRLKQTANIATASVGA